MTNRAAHFRNRIRNTCCFPSARGKPLRKNELERAVRKLGGEPSGTIAEHRYQLAELCGLDKTPFGSSKPFTVAELREIVTELETRRT